MRRRVLLALSLAALLALAGCSVVGPDARSTTDEEPSIFRSFAVNNYDNRSHTVEVVVLHDDSVVYWTTRHVEGKRHDETLGTVVDGAVVDPPEIENTTRRYTVLVRLDDRSTGVRYELRENRTSDCYSMGVEIRDGELHGPSVHHWNDDSGDYCADPA